MFTSVDRFNVEKNEGDIVWRVIPTEDDNSFMKKWKYRKKMTDFKIICCNEIKCKI